MQNYVLHSALMLGSEQTDRDGGGGKESPVYSDSVVQYKHLQSCYDEVQRQNVIKRWR